MSVDEFLESYPPGIKTICQELREVIASLPFDMEERVYVGWKLIGYRVKNGAKSRYVGFIAPCDNDVRLGFEYGIRITHSALPLQGKGTQVRYVSFTKPGQVQRNELIPLILEAVDITLKGKK